jgi:hypothetical protein
MRGSADNTRISISWAPGAYIRCEIEKPGLACVMWYTVTGN